MTHHVKKQLIRDMQSARRRMHLELTGSDQWWAAYYDLRKAESSTK